jgi:hypothetical protein
MAADYPTSTRLALCGVCTLAPSAAHARLRWIPRAHTARTDRAPSPNTRCSCCGGSAQRFLRSVVFHSAASSGPCFRSAATPISMLQLSRRPAAFFRPLPWRACAGASESESGQSHGDATVRVRSSSCRASRGASHGATRNPSQL